MEKTKQNIAIVLVLLFLVAGCSTPTSTPKSTQVNSESLRVAKVSLPGMSCKFCAEGAKNIILGTEGVVDVKIDFSSKTGTILYDETQISKEEIAQSEGLSWYDGQIIEDKEYGG